MSNQPGCANKLAPSFGPDARSVWVAAKEVHGLTPQTPVNLDPRGQDGRPMSLFDRDSGAIDPEVAAYWKKHYDIARLLRAN